MAAEAALLRLVAENRSSQAIAQAPSRGRRAVARHPSDINRTMGMRGRAAEISRILEEGLAGKEGY
jgi:DNA-binding CsgD family transcriptional regulator